jgi:type IV/VI secretion system ImpK/VasF family protein
MIQNKQIISSHNENIIFITQDIIYYFNNIVNNLKLNLNYNSEEVSNFTQDKCLEISRDIEEYISKRIDFLKTSKKYSGTKIIDLLHYALVSLIDEILITTNWEGRKLWSNMTLENHIFSSRSSGDLFFEHCQKIMTDRDYKSRSLAMCYYLCLCSGFRGKYHLQEYQEKIEQIKSDLLQFYDEGNYEKIADCNVILPENNFIINENNFDEKNKKINYTIFTLNLIVLVAFLLLSAFIWNNNKSIIFNNIF